jgi:hypothetical protein
VPSQEQTDIDRPYAAVAIDAIRSTGAPRLLEGHPAVVLERLARAAGATRWFAIQGPHQLEALADKLSPGSCLSLYFDDRIRRAPFTEDVAEKILRIAAEDGDAVVGQLGPDGLEIATEFVAGRSELRDAAQSFRPSEPIFYGRFPANDNDPPHAVTLDLPDRDGIVRSHPH